MHAQTTVDGLRLARAQLAHTLGGAAGRRQQQHLQPHTLKQRHNAAHGGGFAGTGTAGEQQHALFGRQLHRLPLLRRIGDLPDLFDLVNYLVGMPEHLVICVAQGAELFRHIALRLVHPAQVAAVHIGNALLHHRAARQQVVQRDLHRFCVGADELARGRQQLFPRQKHMAVIHVIA